MQLIRIFLLLKSLLLLNSVHGILVSIKLYNDFNYRRCYHQWCENTYD